MALTGTLQADFSSFTTAVQQADVSLKGFEGNAAKVESSLQRMSDSFSGQKIIQDATVMAEVFKRAGGAAGFTEKELARMSATGAEAVAKLTAMGQAVPEGLQRMAAETKNVEKETSTLIGTVKGLAAGFAAMFTARAAFQFVQSTVAEASALKDLAQQTHINVEELQILAGAMSEFGVDADTLGQTLFKLTSKIAKGGDDSLTDALAQMGMALKDVQGLTGEDLFLPLMRGLSKLEGAMLDETATELFGAKMGAAMAGASKDIEGTIETWKRHNTVMSRDTVNSLDQADEAIKRMNKSLGMVAANLIGPVAEGFNVVFAAAQQSSKWAVFVAMAKDLGDSWDMGVESGTHLATLIDQLNIKTAAGAAATAGATKAHREFEPALNDTTGATKAAREAAEELAKTYQKQLDVVSKLHAEEARKSDKKGTDDMDALVARHKANLEQEIKMNQDASIAEAEKGRQKIATAAASEAAYLKEQDALTALTDGLSGVTTAQKAAGDAAVAGTTLATTGFAAVATQVQITGEGIKEWINLMKYAAEANAINRRNSLFQTTSQAEALANIGSSFGQRSGGASVSNTFNIVDTEANIAKRVSDHVTRSVMQAVPV